MLFLITWNAAEAGTLRINVIGAREEGFMGRLIAKEYQSMSVIVVNKRQLRQANRRCNPDNR